jgi:hypothetical protein
MNAKSDEVEEASCIHQWHQQLAHRNLNDIKQMEKQGLKIRSCDCANDCEHCLMGKMARYSFPNKSEPVNDIMD